MKRKNNTESRSKKFIKKDIKEDIIIISRISSEKEDKTSLINQRKFINDYYDFNLHDKVNIKYIDFDGNSAYNKSYYTDTMNTLSTLKNKKFYYSWIDRFSRNVALGSTWLQNIKNNNSTIYFALEELEHPRKGDYHRIIDGITAAQDYAESLSEKQKLAHIAKKQRGEFKQTSAFGCSFDEKRSYEIKILVLIDLLKSVGHENIIELHYLKKLLKSIVLSMPIDEKNMIKKIKYIDDYDSYSDEDLSSEFTDLDICDLLSNYGIYIIKKNNENYYEIEIVTDFIYYPDYFYWGNPNKKKDNNTNYLTNKIKKYIPDFNDKINNYKLNDISKLILKLSQKKDDHYSIVKLTNKIIELNYDSYPELRYNLGIKVKSSLKIPEDIKIRLDFQDRDPIKKKDKDTKKLCDILNKFNENRKIQEFEDKYLEFKQLFLKYLSSKDFNIELHSLMLNSLIIDEIELEDVNNDGPQNNVRKKQNIQHLDIDE